MTLFQILLLVLTLMGQPNYLHTVINEVGKPIYSSEINPNQQMAESFVNGCIAGGFNQTMFVYEQLNGEQLKLTEETYTQLITQIYRSCVGYLKAHGHEFGIDTSKVDFTVFQ